MVFICLSVFAYCYFLSFQVEKRFSGRRWEIPSTIYSDTTLLYPGKQINLSSVVKRLTGIGYHENKTLPEHKGNYVTNNNSITIYLNDLKLQDRVRPGFPVIITFLDGFISGIKHMETKEEQHLLELEPEIIMEVFNEERELREPVLFENIPDTLKCAVMAAEDARFYSHMGVDPAGILRAIYTNLRHGAIRQGGSTLTQQLAKNYFLTHERTFSRKIQELFLAIAIEIKYEKDEILELYLNEIYFGQNGSVSINGAGAAAEFYFGKKLPHLSIAEQASIAGLIKGPNLYSPYANPNKCTARRNVVLKSMLSRSWITEEEYEKAVARDVQPSGYNTYKSRAPYFLDYLYSQLTDLYPPETLTSMGYSIYTTLDTQVQQAAELSLKNGLLRIEKNISGLTETKAKEKLQGAILVMHPRTGNILALVGGRNYRESQFNRITQAKRQSGSCFKPVIVSLFLDRFTPSDMLSNEEKIYDTGNGTWTPKNFSESTILEMTLCDMLKISSNRAAVDLIMRGGVDVAVKKLEAFNFHNKFNPYPSLILGSSDVTPMDMARAYSTFAADGIQPYPLSLKGVVDEQGNTLLRKHIEMTSVLTSEEAFLVTTMLKTAVNEGTGRSLRQQGIRFPMAGKTGTTNNFRDGWFIGYTPDILALVWVGYDNGRTLTLSGGKTALPIWADLMKSIPDHISENDFSVPPGVIKKTICRESGMLAVKKRCPDIHEEYFLIENAMNDICTLHGKKSDRVFYKLKNIFKKDKKNNENQ